MFSAASGLPSGGPFASGPLSMHRPRVTLLIVVTVLHTASVPTASCTGTRRTGTLLPVSGVRAQPTATKLTGSSTVYQTCRHCTHLRWRVTLPASLPLVLIALISPLLQRGHSIGNLNLYPATMAQ